MRNNNRNKIPHAILAIGENGQPYIIISEELEKVHQTPSGAFRGVITEITEEGEIIYE